MKTSKALDDLSTLMGQERRGGPAPADLYALTIVSHPRGRRAGERFVLGALGEGRKVALSRNAPDFVRPGNALGEPLADPFLSRKPIEFALRAPGLLRLRMPEGGPPANVAGAPLRGERELGPAELDAGVTIELGERIVLLLHRLGGPEAPGPSAGRSPLLGESPGIREVRKGIERVAGFDVPVLVRGETGTGKELVARALHEQGPRRGGRLVSVNLGAVPKELAAVELFGARRGGYTGASRDRDGLFVAAQNGTLFLDEVGEAPPEVQAMLLRALETGEFYPVGSSTPVTTNARVVAATDAKLEAQIRDGQFKAPLLHRLAGYEIRMPALRERREDIGLLFYHFAGEQLEALGEAHRLEPADAQAEPFLPAQLAARLLLCAWPGNVRQLRNVARQIVIDSRGEPCARLSPRLARELSAEPPDAPAPLSPPPTPPAPPSPPPSARPGEAPPARRRPSDVSPEELVAALRESGWDLQATADRLGVSRPSLYDLIEKSPHVRTAGDLSAEEITKCVRECGGDLDAAARRLEVSRRALGRRVKELGIETPDA